MIKAIILLVVMAFAGGFIVAKATTIEFEDFIDEVMYDEEFDRDASEDSH